jgi:hypothetical protein
VKEKLTVGSAFFRAFPSTRIPKAINLLAPGFFFNFSTPCIYNVNNIGTKYVRIMKQTAF